MAFVIPLGVFAFAAPFLATLPAGLAAATAAGLLAALALLGLLDEPTRLGVRDVTREWWPAMLLWGALTMFTLWRLGLFGAETPVRAAYLGRIDATLVAAAGLGAWTVAGAARGHGWRPLAQAVLLGGLAAEGLTALVLLSSSASLSSGLGLFGRAVAPGAILSLQMALAGFVLLDELARRRPAQQARPMSGLPRRVLTPLVAMAAAATLLTAGGMTWRVAAVALAFSLAAGLWAWRASGNRRTVLTILAAASGLGGVGGLMMASAPLVPFLALVTGGLDGLAAGGAMGVGVGAGASPGAAFAAIQLAERGWIGVALGALAIGYVAARLAVVTDRRRRPSRGLMLLCSLGLLLGLGGLAAAEAEEPVALALITIVIGLAAGLADGRAAPVTSTADILDLVKR